MTKNDLAERLGRTTRAIEWMVYAGTGPRSAKIGGRRMWREADVEQWIDEQFEKESA